jgi:hypothetical protein
MVSATTTSKGKSKPAAQPPTFDEVARSKMRDTLTEYRKFVERAAKGEQLSVEELDRVLELLAHMALPDFAWDRDIKAQREHTANANRESELMALLPDSQTRAAATTKRIEALEKELLTLKTQLHRDTKLLPMQLIDHGRKKNELVTLNPHLFVNIDDAVRLRMAEKNKGRPLPAEPLGWST